MADLDIASYTRPLVLIADTCIQRLPKKQGKTFPAPAVLTPQSYNILQSGMSYVAVRTGFNFIHRPIYEIYDDYRFSKKQRRHFWKPILEKQFPIYVVSPLMGLVWPGNEGGLYTANMEDWFLTWKARRLWNVVLDIYEKAKCDVVLSYLPHLYDNIVHAETLPWFIFEPDKFVDHQNIFLDIVKNQPLSTEP